MHHIRLHTVYSLSAIVYCSTTKQSTHPSIPMFIQCGVGWYHLDHGDNLISGKKTIYLEKLRRGEQMRIEYKGGSSVGDCGYHDKNSQL